jgi:hypothetical protein
MKKISIAAFSLLFSTALLLAQTPDTPAWGQTPAKPDEKTLSDAYTYLLGRTLAIRQEHIDRRGDGFAYNAIKYNPLGSADFVNPNFDVAYFEAWFAVDDRTPALLEIPGIKGRYYTAQILDEWGEVIANINERTFPSKPYGKFALVKPGFRGTIPIDAARIELHSSKAKMLGRVEIKDDPEGAVRLQQQFKVTALGTPLIAPPPAITMFKNADLIGAEIFDDVDAKLSSALECSRRFAPSRPMWRPVRKRARQSMRSCAGLSRSSRKTR